MDFIILYSKYSERCEALFNEIPLLAEKAFCIDNKRARQVLNKLPCKVYGVPTLLITDGMDKLLKVIDGYDDIKSWFILTTYSLTPKARPEQSSFVDLPHTSSQTMSVPGISGVPEMRDELMPNDDNFTSLDDLIMDNTAASNKADRVIGVKATAEQLQRERESYIEQTASSKKVI
jgi:hypothetical protein